MDSIILFSTYWLGVFLLRQREFNPEQPGTFEQKAAEKEIVFPFLLLMVFSSNPALPKFLIHLWAASGSLWDACVFRLSLPSEKATCKGFFSAEKLTEKGLTSVFCINS